MADLIEIALEAAHAGADLLRERRGGRLHQSSKSSLTDMVTDVDRASEDLIIEVITSHRPHDAIVGEERGARPGTTGVEWVIDPLDGTTNFIYGYPGYNVSVGVEVDGRRQAGVVVDPFHEETFRAVAGAGAWCNDAPIVASTPASLQESLVATGFSYDPDRRRAQATVLTRLLPRIRDIRRGGAAALDLCWVACGRVDAFYEHGLQRWDFSAGALIAAEAGAVVSDLRGGPPEPGSVYAASPAVAAELRAALADAGALDLRA